MSPRAVKITITLLVVATLLAAAYVLVPKVGTGHRHLNTAGKIVFLSDNDAQNLPHVFLIAEDGTGMKDLTPGAQSCADPAFSPDGSQIAYISDKPGQPQVCIMDADGQHPHAITFGTSAKSLPQFSPDGRSLAYISEGTITSIDLQSNETDLLRTNPESSTAAAGVITSDVSHTAALTYSWSPIPTGSNVEPELATVQEQDGVPGQPDEEALTLLTSPEANPVMLISAPNISICWSPDGTKLYSAILGARVGPQQQPFSGIVTFGADGKPAGTQPIAPTNSASLGPTEPSITPDGKLIAFLVQNQPDLAHTTTLGLYVEPVDNSAAPKAVITGPVKAASWSPDGLHLLALLPRRSGAGQDLWVSAINGSSAPTNLTLGHGDVTSAAWSPTSAKAG